MFGKIGLWEVVAILAVVLLIWSDQAAQPGQGDW